MPETTFEWNIIQLERRPTDDLVRTVHWTVQASNGNCRAQAYGSVDIDPISEGEIVPYSEITPELAIGWAQAALDVEAIEASLQCQLNEQAEPALTPGLPWL